MPRKAWPDRQPAVMLFADGVHFDFGTTFNEAHYITGAVSPPVASGYVHFRHRGEGQYVFLDGHVESQPLQGVAYPVRPGGGAAGNLTGGASGKEIYGF
jgi:prepilin-type processing-associated H-X9-DG protein